MEKNKYRLKIWSATVFNEMPFVFWGKVYGNPKFPDGLLIHTSQVLNVTTFEDHKEVETLNSIYCIYPGEVHPTFAVEYPDFYENLDGNYFDSTYSGEDYVDEI